MTGYEITDLFYCRSYPYSISNSGFHDMKIIEFDV